VITKLMCTIAAGAACIFLAAGAHPAGAAPARATTSAAAPALPCPPGAGVICDAVEGGVDAVVPDSVSDALSFASDPFGYMAKSIGDAVGDLAGWMLKAIDTTTLVQLDNKEVAIVFAKVWGVATFVTILMWLFNVFKNTRTGASPQQIIGDSIGLLLLSVVATAIALPVFALVLALVDGFASAMVGDVDQNLGSMTTQMTKALGVVSSGSPFMGIIFGLLLLVALLLIWAMLVVRAASLVFAAALSPLVFSCLVARDRWDAMKRPLGVVVALILSKYIVYVALALSTGFLSAWNEDQSTVYGAVGALMLGTAMLWTAVFGSYKIAAMVPVVGDDMRQTMTERSSMGPMAMAGMGMGAARLIPGGGGGGGAPSEVSAGAQHFGASSEIAAGAGPAGAAVMAASAGKDAAVAVGQNAQAQVDGHAAGAPGGGGDGSGSAPPPASPAPGASTPVEPAAAPPGPAGPSGAPGADAPPASSPGLAPEASDPIDVGGSNP
jgi:hypothetical protein